MKLTQDVIKDIIVGLGVAEFEGQLSKERVNEICIILEHKPLFDS